MKTKLLIFCCIFLLGFKIYDVVAHHPVTRFIMDDRPKAIMYCNFSPKLIHIDIECLDPVLVWGKDSTYHSYANINIFFFLSDFSLMHTFGHRYIKLQET